MNGQSIIGNWTINWDAGWIAPRGRFWRKKTFPDARLISVLALLAQNNGQVVSSDEILEQAWPDRVVSRDSVSTAIYQLRQTLGDDSKKPIYIRTEGRKGYRLVARQESADGYHLYRRWGYAAVGTMLLASGVGAWQIGQDKDTSDVSLFIAAIEDQTSSSGPVPLHLAIETTLLGELVGQMPGQVTDVFPVDDPGLLLKSTIVECDRGPALVVNLVDLRTDRHLWSDAYPMSQWDNETGQPTMVQKVAHDVREAVLTF